jgi:hypothetical protein
MAVTRPRFSGPAAASLYGKRPERGASSLHLRAVGKICPRRKRLVSQDWRDSARVGDAVESATNCERAKGYCRFDQTQLVAQKERILF